MVFGGTSKMALCVKAFDATPDGPSSISKTHVVEDDWLQQVVLWPWHTCLSRPTHSRAHTERNKQTYFKKKLKNILWASAFHGWTWIRMGGNRAKSFQIFLSTVKAHTVLADRKHPCSGSCPEAGCPPSPPPSEKPLCILGALRTGTDSLCTLCWVPFLRNVPQIKLPDHFARGKTGCRGRDFTLSKLTPTTIRIQTLFFFFSRRS